MDKGIVVPKELKHIHHSPVATEKIHVLSFYLRKSTDVCEKSRQFKSSLEMVSKFQLVSQHCLGLSYKNVTEENPHQHD